MKKNIKQEFPDESLNEVEDFKKYHKYYDEEGKEITPENIPIKRIVWFEHSGHSPWINESEKFVEELLRVKNIRK